MTFQDSFNPGQAERVYKTLIASGLKLRLDENETIQVSPKEKMTPEFRKMIKTYRAGLLALLMNKPVNSFEDSIEKADNPILRPFLEEIYKKAFYNLVAIVFNDSGNSLSQHAGCDTMIYLTNDRLYRIDEKIRYKYYGDIALEYISNDTRNTPGWMEKDLGINYLNYVVYPERQAFLLPWQQLKFAWNKNKKVWMKLASNKSQGFSIIKAANDTYNTLSCCVPTDILIDSVKDAMIIKL